jgi:chromosomal replication initiator protein
MHAIGNEINYNNKDMKILYVTSEKFTNAFINALKDNNVENFRQKHRNIDVLLIDDIQFIAGKERLQEEFFHTFNTLHESGKQIIMSSDRPPRDIPLLEDRLRSRFEWGLLADVSMVDYETRLAILRKKTDEKQIIINDNILSNIAAKIDSNIRELEGVFNKLVAQSSLTHTEITMEMSERAINDIIKQKESIISVEYIQESVCKYFNVTKEEILGSHRSNDIAFPRQIGMYLCRILTNASFPQIGDAFGKRDHTTVIHAFKKVEKEIKENTNTKLIVESVKKLILNKE